MTVKKTAQGVVVEKKPERKRLTRQQAIRAMCMECMCWVTKSVTDCCDKACPLWPFRSGSGEEDCDIPIRSKEK